MQPFFTFFLSRTQVTGLLKRNSG